LACPIAAVKDAEPPLRRDELPPVLYDCETRERAALLECGRRVQTATASTFSRKRTRP